MKKLYILLGFISITVISDKSLGDVARSTIYITVHILPHTIKPSTNSSATQRSSREQQENQAYRCAHSHGQQLFKRAQQDNNHRDSYHHPLEQCLENVTNLSKTSGIQLTEIKAQQMILTISPH